MKTNGRSARRVGLGMVGGMLALMAGCQAMPLSAPPQPPGKPVSMTQTPVHVQSGQVHAVKVRKRKPQLIKIIGIGYGSESTYDGYTPGQRRLMAIRASKLDAYRSLAEQIKGIKIDSNTTVSALMAKNDNFRARVNAIIRGARVVSVTPMPDHNYETVLEVYVDKRFFRQNMVYTPGGEEVQEHAPQTMQCDVHFNCTTPERM